MPSNYGQFQIRPTTLDSINTDGMSESDLQRLDEARMVQETFGENKAEKQRQFWKGFALTAGFSVGAVALFHFLKK